MKKYVIIDADAIQQRIEELEQEYNQEPEEHMKDWFLGQIEALKQILSQSTPLIPEIEKAFDVSNNYTEKSFKDFKKDYISNLKLDI